MTIFNISLITVFMVAYYWCDVLHRVYVTIAVCVKINLKLKHDSSFWGKKDMFCCINPIFTEQTNHLVL